MYGFPLKVCSKSFKTQPLLRLDKTDGRCDFKFSKTEIWDKCKSAFPTNVASIVQSIEKGSIWTSESQKIDTKANGCWSFICDKPNAFNKQNATCPYFP